MLLSDFGRTHKYATKMIDSIQCFHICSNSSKSYFHYSNKIFWFLSLHFSFVDFVLVGSSKQLIYIAFSVCTFYGLSYGILLSTAMKG